jgi:(4-(4-[2-(gamma-L-glutamylamino)ethyl]phenoxymethyl)furan-2-yl)methanamine synthase
MPAATDLLALDIGGANLKAADGLGWAASVAFPLWQRWRDLPDAIVTLVADRPPRRLVATMTGEICDCYPSRAAGVAHIAESLLVASDRAGCAEPPAVYLVDGRIVTVAEATRDWRLAAASNWHATARLAVTLLPAGDGLLLDIGSTTTDIVPLREGRPAPRARDDAGRLSCRELVYTGVERTPVAAVAPCLPHRGTVRPVASERFADSRDAWLVLGALAEDPAARDTADGGPATRNAARVRLARTMLLDPEDYTMADAAEAADAIAARQAVLVSLALEHVARGGNGPPDAIVLAGHGDRLAERALDRAGWRPRIERLAAAAGPAAARAAPAHALALLARGSIR